MNLFEKVDLFEKMATDLTDGEELPEIPANLDNISTAHVRRESIKIRRDLLKYLAKG